MKFFIKIIIIVLLSYNVFAREKGEIEITTDDGVEVFQNDKFYLLKKNVKIKSDTFSLNADSVKINFNKNLYDITELNAEGNVNFESSEFQIKGSGKFLVFEVQIEKIKVKGENSELIAEDISMFSDGTIEVNNLSGDFSLDGINSKLISENLIIKGKSIDGIFSKNLNGKEITFLEVIDDNLSYVKNRDTEMYAEKINFNNETSMIELIENVLIIRNEEKITGDYGTLDTKNNSYKIKSNNNTKVKVIIQSDD